MEEDVAAEHFSPPTTRDVLGAHLHQKVSETLSGHLIDAKVRTSFRRAFLIEVHLYAVTSSTYVFFSFSCVTSQACKT